MIRRRSPLVLAATLAMGCAHVPETAPVSKAAPHPDPDPIYTRDLTVDPPTTHPTIEARVQGKWVADGHAYLAVELPDGPAATDLVACQVHGPRHGVCVMHPASRRSTWSRPGSTTGESPPVLGPGLVGVRLVGKTMPDAVEFTLYRRGERALEPGTVQPVSASGGKAAPDDKTLALAFYRTASTWLASRSDSWRFRIPFYVYAQQRLLRMSEPNRRRGQPRPTRRRKSDVGETMSLFTGLTSVEEALQVDRGLMIRGDKAGERSAPLSKVEALDLPAHPWEEMLGELEGKPEPVVEPLAAYVPHDMLYTHFHDMRTFVGALDELSDLVTPLALATESRPGLAHFADRIENQLVVERTGLARTFGHLAAKGVAIAASDPLFVDGTDVSMLFHVESATILSGALATFEARAREERADLEAGTYQLGDVTVGTLTTPDGVHRQHRATLGEVLILSNSRRAMERFVAVQQGEAKPLAKSGDFRYMRALYPFSKTEEDGFAFLGDAFVAHVTSPRIKIAQARRTEARADLLALNHAALLFGWLEGRPPKGTDELVASKLMGKAELRDMDGRRLHLDPARGAHSAYWGRPVAMRPLLEVDVDKVTEAERLAYERFAQTYQRYWRGFIDPIAIRIRRGVDGKRLSVDARILPVIEGSEYRDIIRMVGEEVMPIRSIEGGLEWSLAISRDGKLRREANKLSRSMTRSKDIGIDWLGAWIAVGVLDRNALWDMVVASGEIPPRKRGRSRDEKKIVPRFPIYLAVDVDNKLGLAAALTALKTYASTAAPGAVSWELGAPYRQVAITVIEEAREPGEERGEEDISLSYAIVKGMLVFAVDRMTLEILIDQALDGGPEPSEARVQTAIRLAPRGAQSPLVKMSLGLMEKQIWRNHVLAGRSFEALARGLGSLPDEPGERRARALSYLGYEPAGAHGGTFTMGEDGLVSHSLYGTEIAPTPPALPVTDSPASALLTTLKDLGMGLSIEGEGNHRGLHAVMEWQRR